jgi:integrase
VPTFREFGHEFLETYAAVHNKPSEQFNKRAMLRAHLLPRLGHLRIDRIGMREVEALKAALLQRGLAAKSVNNIVALLGRMLRYAVEVGVLGVAPRTRLLRVPQQPFDFLAFAEYARLLDAARAEPEGYAAILFAGDTGARMGELLALTWDDVDLKAGTVRISRSDWMGQVTGTKTGRVRTVPLTQRLRKALAAHRHLRGPRVFSRDDGAPWTKEVLRALLPRVCRAAGLRRMRWHSLRHTFASHLAMTGAHPREIQELGGWSTLGMVERYTHLTPARLRGAVERLETPDASGEAEQRTS